MIALSRAYPSVHGAPVLRAVDPRIFSLRYFTHCMECGFCADRCCSYGVDIDAQNAARLLALPADFKSRVATPERDWFTDEAEDAEFPSGRYRRTQTAGGRCVFHSVEGRGCAIHAYCLEKGIDYHDLKPMVSVLFPLTFERGALMPSSEALEGSLVCAGAGPALYEGVRGELAYYFGAALVEELDRIKASRAS